MQLRDISPLILTRSCLDLTWSPRCSKDGQRAPCTTGSGRQHLPYYLDEFTFRFNRRTSRARGLLFYRLLQQAADTDPHPLAELIGGTGNDSDEPTDD
jgi:hypothetical protein